MIIVNSINKINGKWHTKKLINKFCFLQGWGSWGGWGSSLLSTATSSVSSLGSHVISTVIDTVESGLGAPDPEDIAKEQIGSLF